MISPRRRRSMASIGDSGQTRAVVSSWVLRFLSRRHLNEKKARVVASGFDLGRDPMSKRHEIVSVDPNADLFEL